MIFILWSLHTGITCGCQLYEMAVITSLVATAAMVILGHVNKRMKTHILVVHCKSSEGEDRLKELLEKNTGRYRIKSRNYTEKGMDYVFEIVARQAADLACAMEMEESVERFSLMEYDSDDVL